MSVELASRVLSKIRGEASGAHLAGQESKRDFEQAVEDFLGATLPEHENLYAWLSRKWTVGYEAQKAGSEALDLILTSKGRVPHIMMVVTAEPLPSRLATVALGTRDFDAVYHVALDELIQSTVDLFADSPEAEDTLSLLRLMVDGKRLKDISELPMDLAT